MAVFWPFWANVTIFYRVREFKNFFENFVQGTRCPPLKSHIPLKDTVSLPKDLSPKLKRISAREAEETHYELDDYRNPQNLSEKDSIFGRYGLNSVPIGAFFSRSLQYVVTTKMSQLA